MASFPVHLVREIKKKKKKKKNIVDLDEIIRIRIQCCF